MAQDRPDLIAELEGDIEEGWEAELLRQRLRENGRHHALISAWIREIRPPDSET